MIPPYVIVPYWYFLETRLNGLFQKISWAFVYFVPSLYLYFQFADITSAYDCGIFLVAVLLINYVYENGYIENDIRTIRKEQNPTLRLPAESIKIIDHNFITIFLIRILVTLSLLGIYFFFVTRSNTIKRPVDLVFALVLLQVLYLFYNRVRSSTNLFLILPLSFIRFFGFILPFIPLDEILIFTVMTVLIYPLSKFLEFTKRQRFDLRFWPAMIGSIDKFRAKYYFLLVLLLIGVKFLFASMYIDYYLIIAIYFLFYRMLGIVAIRNKSILSEFKGNFGRE